MVGFYISRPDRLGISMGKSLGVSPYNVTLGTPLSPGRISISFMGETDPLFEMPRDLKMALRPNLNAASSSGLRSPEGRLTEVGELCGLVQGNSALKMSL